MGGTYIAGSSTIMKVIFVFFIFFYQKISKKNSSVLFLSRASQYFTVLHNVRTCGLMIDNQAISLLVVIEGDNFSLQIPEVGTYIRSTVLYIIYLDYDFYRTFPVKYLVVRCSVKKKSFARFKNDALKFLGVRE